MEIEQIIIELYNIDNYLSEIDLINYVEVKGADVIYKANSLEEQEFVYEILKNYENNVKQKQKKQLKEKRLNLLNKLKNKL